LIPAYLLVKVPCGGVATRLLPRDRGVEELHEDLTVGPRPKVWNRGQKWKKWYGRWRAIEAQMRNNPGRGESDPAEGVRGAARRILLPFYPAA